MMAQLSTRRSFIGGGLATAAVGANAMTTAGHMAMIASGGAKLPYDAEVEYLESTGTQWIDTGVYGDLDTVAEFRACATAKDALYPLFGARDTYRTKALAVYNGSDVGYVYTVSYDNYYGGNASHVSSVSADIGAWTDFRIGKQTDIGGWTKDYSSVASAFTTSHTLCLFAWNQNGTIAYGKYKVSFLKIYQNNVLVRDFIPVRFTNELGQSEGAMYDRVSGKLFRNQGTGAFLYGGDVYSIPVETNQYVQDGLVAMWDGKENAGVGKHSPNATVWKDLVGGYDFAIPSSGASFTDDCVTLNNSSLSASLQEVARPEFTIECIAESTGFTGAWLWMRNPSWIGGVLVGWQSNGRCYFPWYEIGSLGGQGMASAGLAWDGSNQVLYKDSSAIASTARAIDSRNILSAIYVGEYNGDKKTTMNCYSIRLYNRALTAAEIAANYAIDKERFNLP